MTQITDFRGQGAKINEVEQILNRELTVKEIVLAIDLFSPHGLTVNEVVDIIENGEG